MKNNKLKAKKRVIVSLIIVIVIVILCLGAYLIYMLSNNYVSYENIDSTSTTNSFNGDSTRKIIINNFLVGGVSDTGYIDATRIYQKSKEATSIDLFDIDSSFGTFNTINFIAYNEKYFTKISKDNVPEDYIAIEHSDNIAKSSMLRSATKIESTNKDKKYVKEALAKYRLLNFTIKINSVYEVNIQDNSDKIICVMSDSSNKLAIGAYSAVIYVHNGNASIVKYSYVRDKKNASAWPLYDFKFALDIDQDKVSEIVLQQATEYYNEYSILKLKEDKFYEVLNLSLKIE